VDAVFFESQAGFREWLERNHATEDALLIGFHKKASGRGGLTYREALDEALCFGWIDGVRTSLGPDAYSQRFTPRRKRSIWSNVNVKRFGELQSEGRAAPAGRAAFDSRTADRTGIYSAEQREIELEPGHLARLQADEAAWAYWRSAPPSYRKPATWWVISAKKPETRERRFVQLLNCSAKGERVPPLRPLGRP
jgi:uncharacterized protein YdeI (YjbR/CyaY-like superfamily)